LRTGRRPIGSHKPECPVRLWGPQLIFSRAGRRSAGFHMPGSSVRVRGSATERNDRVGQLVEPAGREPVKCGFDSHPGHSASSRRRTWGRSPRGRRPPRTREIGVQFPAGPPAKRMGSRADASCVLHTRRQGSTPCGSTRSRCVRRPRGAEFDQLSGRLEFVPRPAVAEHTSISSRRSLAEHPCSVRQDRHTDGSRIRLGRVALLKR
jgi:hypothetical protein